VRIVSNQPTHKSMLRGSFHALEVGKREDVEQLGAGAGPRALRRARIRRSSSSGRIGRHGLGRVRVVVVTDHGHARRDGVTLGPRSDRVEPTTECSLLAPFGHCTLVAGSTYSHRIRLPIVAVGGLARRVSWSQAAPTYRRSRIPAYQPMYVFVRGTGRHAARLVSFGRQTVTSTAPSATTCRPAAGC
jgi:hypothetical protein